MYRYYIHFRPLARNYEVGQYRLVYPCLPTFEAVFQSRSDDSI